MKAELSGLKPSELSKRASAEGIAQTDIDRAVDSDNPKEQLIDLIVRRVAATAKSKKTMRARKAKKGEFSAGQACCVVSSTVLVLFAISAGLCMFSVRVPCPAMAVWHTCFQRRVLDLSWHPCAGRVLRCVRDVGDDGGWYTKFDVPATVKRRGCAGACDCELC